jgi:site-specific recombinase
MPSDDSRSNSDSPFRRFERVMKALVQVPKKEVEQKTAQVRRKRSKRKKSSA